MPRYKITYDKEKCIGAMTCVANSPDSWEYDGDRKVNLKGAVFNKETQKYELIIESNDDRFEKDMDAATGCPVDGVIKIERLDD
ncbi:ferredoxin [Candidatus Woesearchaeota archaeon]|nr:ferredoxin [Candidatus Woesearchaeota archaeon]